MEEKQSNTEEYIKIFKESSEKKRGYIFAAITIAVSVILIVFAVSPTISTITKINSEITEKKQLNTSLDNKIDALSKLDKQYTGAEDQFNDLKLIFPADGDFSLLLANIEPILSRDGFSLGGLNFNEYQDDDFTLSTKVLEPYSFKLTVIGTSSNIVNLLKDLESLPMSPVIESLSYTDQKDSNNATTFNIELRVYKIDNVNFYN